VEAGVTRNATAIASPPKKLKIKKCHADPTGIQIQLPHLRPAYRRGNGVERTPDSLSLVPNANHHPFAAAGREKVCTRAAVATHHAAGFC